MKANRKVMLGAALVVAVVALAAVGYAAVSYKAETDNNDNSLAVTYVYFTQGGEGKFTGDFIGAIYYNTVTEANNVVKYSVVTTDGYTINGNAAAKVDNGNFTLQLTDTETAPTTYVVTITTSATLPTGVTFYFGLKNGEAEPTWAAGSTSAGTTTWTFTGVTEATYDVLVGATGTNLTTAPGAIPDIDFNIVATVTPS